MGNRADGEGGGGLPTDSGPLRKYVGMTTKKDASPEYAGPTLGKGTGGGSQEDRSDEGAAGSEGAESSETPEGVEIAEGEDMVLPAGGILTA